MLSHIKDTLALLPRWKTPSQFRLYLLYSNKEFQLTHYRVTKLHTFYFLVLHTRKSYGKISMCIIYYTFFISIVLCSRLYQLHKFLSFPTWILLDIGLVLLQNNSKQLTGMAEFYHGEIGEKELCIVLSYFTLHPLFPPLVSCWSGSCRQLGHWLQDVASSREKPGLDSSVAQSRMALKKSSDKYVSLKWPRSIRAPGKTWLHHQQNCQWSTSPWQSQCCDKMRKYNI